MSTAPHLRNVLDHARLARYPTRRRQTPVRAAAAAGLAWAVCTTAFGSDAPYPAALAALLVTEASAFRSLVAAAQYSVGCALGVLIAVPVAVFVHPTLPALCLVVFASVVAAQHDRLGHHGVHVPITALFAFAMARSQLWDDLAPHVLETAVGVAIGAMLNAVVFPPLHLRPAERALGELRDQLARVLELLALALRDRRLPQELLGPDWAAGLDRAVRRADDELTAARESRRWNLRSAARGSVRHLDDDVLDALARVADRAREIGRLLDDERDERGPSPAPRRDAAQRRGDPVTPAFRPGGARLLVGTALCVRSCAGGRPHPILPAARWAGRRLHTAAGSTKDHGLARQLEDMLASLDDGRGAPTAEPAPGAGGAVEVGRR
ncbi:aromatic acid exporter family protein [Streptomyces sp. NPDC086787]|uniref:FUSC family protein n=1 Tax=Streptomyces sp. NPDC086787 TaxID=3365759 RepID=UPI0038290E66